MRKLLHDYFHLFQSLLFIKVVGLKPATLLKKRLWQKVFWEMKTYFQIVNTFSMFLQVSEFFVLSKNIYKIFSSRYYELVPHNAI